MTSFQEIAKEVEIILKEMDGMMTLYASRKHYVTCGQKMHKRCMSYKIPLFILLKSEILNYFLTHMRLVQTASFLSNFQTIFKQTVQSLSFWHEKYLAKVSPAVTNIYWLFWNRNICIMHLTGEKYIKQSKAQTVHCSTAIMLSPAYLSHVTRKPVFGVCDKLRLKPSCSADETS